jgi:hypothetical protein
MANSFAQVFQNFSNDNQDSGSIEIAIEYSISGLIIIYKKKNKSGEILCPYMNMDVINVGPALKSWYSSQRMMASLNAHLAEKRISIDVYHPFHVVQNPEQLPFQNPVAHHQGDFPEHPKFKQPEAVSFYAFKKVVLSGSYE